MSTESVESEKSVSDDDIVETVRHLCWCGIYTRQSRDPNSDYSSCEAQLDACQAVVRSRFDDGWVCNGHQYDDEAESSETLERPGLQRLLEHRETDGIDSGHASPVTHSRCRDLLCPSYSGIDRDGNRACDIPG